MRELLVILVVCLLVFGTKKLKSIGADLGGAVRDFKKAMDDGEKNAPPPQQTAAASAEPPQITAQSSTAAPTPSEKKEAV